MSITPEAPAKTLTQLVARQIRVAMAVEDIRQSELSRRMGKTEQWLSVRLRGKQAIDVNDLLLFARALGVSVYDLMPSREDADGATDPRLTAQYSLLAVQSPITDRPRDNRPNGRPAHAGSVIATRTAHLDRPHRRRRDR